MEAEEVFSCAFVGFQVYFVPIPVMTVIMNKKNKSPVVMVTHYPMVVLLITSDLVGIGVVTGGQWIILSIIKYRHVR